MPNWCSNELTVTGDEKEVARFKRVANGKDRWGRDTILSEQPFIPYPKRFSEPDLKCQKLRDAYEEKCKRAGVNQMTEAEKEKWLKDNPDSSWQVKNGFNSGGYEWCIKNWGTKWGFCDAELVCDDKDFLEYRFETAWSPPIPLIKKMGEMFPKLTFQLKYTEEGMGFFGGFSMKEGKVKTDQCIEW